MLKLYTQSHQYLLILEPKIHKRYHCLSRKYQCMDIQLEIQNNMECVN
jgi:hypothetical protein